MLPCLRSLGPILRPRQPLNARFITTLPRPFQSYKRLWDPTSRIPQEPGPTIPRYPALEHARRRERAQLCHAHEDVAVLPRKGEVFAPQVRHYALRLNNLMRQAESTEDYPALHFMLRDTCIRLKEASPVVFAYCVPEQAWDIIWKVQEKASKRVHHIPPPHVKQLGDGLDSVFDYAGGATGYKPVGHRIHYLVELFSKNEEQALIEWEQDRLGTNTLPRHDYKPEHLELGVTMYASHGDPDRAHEIMKELFELYPTWSRSVAKAVFSAYAASEQERHKGMAYVAYKEATKWADQLELKDYDVFFNGFLEIHKLVGAKMVFRDMIKFGRLATSLELVEVEKVLTRFHSMLRLAWDVSKMTSIGLFATSVLPQAYHHHVYDHWLRIAMLERSPEVAAQVLERMFDHGTQPRTVHFNLLLKAFLRSRKTSYISKGESIGWRMIEATEKADYRKLPEITEEAASQGLKHKEAAKMISGWKGSEPGTSAAETSRLVAQANVTTFALLIKHHSIKCHWEHVDYLKRKFEETGLPPNAELLNSLLDAKSRQGKHVEAWTIYRSLTHAPEGTPGVFPNGMTMRLIWRSLRCAYADIHWGSRPDLELPTPRELLAETVQWWERCRARPDVDRFRIGVAGKDLGAFWGLVVHCFSTKRDLPGSLVALHIFRKYLGIFPTERIVENYIRQAVWEDLGEMETASDRWRFLNLDVGYTHKALVRVSRQLYEHISSREIIRLNRRGIYPAELSWVERKELQLNILTEFVRASLRKDHDGALVEAAIYKAKKDIGVPDMTI